MTDTIARETAAEGAVALGAIALTVNGEGRETRAATLEALLQDLGYGDRKVATAVNGDFVRAALRADTRLAPGDAVDIVAPMQGG
ncbi:MAG: sulfur carrier protein ThiS [Rhodospirillales bacterium]